jgi:hypothetical protein
MHTRTISMLLGAMLSTGVVLAQAQDQSAPSSNPQATQTDKPRSHPMADPDQQAKHLKKKLNLSDSQVDQIKPVLQDRVQQMQSLHSDTSLSQQDRKDKARQIVQDSNTKIEAVLNDTQKQQFEQMMQQRSEHHKSQAQPQAQTQPQ